MLYKFSLGLFVGGTENRDSIVEVVEGWLMPDDCVDQGVCAVGGDIAGVLREYAVIEAKQLVHLATRPLMW